jgi:LL-diaminopimelate aminotransferase
LEAIPAAVAQQAKMMFLNYPNNPTGAVATREFFEHAVEFARQWDLVLVQDAAYSEVAFDGYEPLSILEIEGAKELSLEIHSFSKTFNMTGWRVAWAAGGADPVGALSKVKANVDSGTFMAIQRAGVKALEHYDSWVPQMRGEYESRRNALVTGLNSLGWNLDMPQATFYVWTPIPPGFATSADFSAALLKECEVLVIPGTAYGAAGEGFVRWSLTIKGEDKVGQIEEAIGRLREKMPSLWA